MKQKKSASKKNTSLNRVFFKVFIIGLVCVALYLILSSKNATPKITPTTDINPVSICSNESYPVCGKDGKTYTNSCTAEKIANVRVAYTGKCRDEQLTNTATILPVTTVSTGVEVDSGIENIGPIPKYTTDRADSGSIIPLSETGTVEILSGNINTFSGQMNPTWISYLNSSYHYGFSMPKNSYYQAFGGQNGATHSVGISSGTGVESLATSQVRIYFYANKILDQLSLVTSGTTTDTTTGTIYVLLNKNNSVAIESDNPTGELVQTILQTLHME